MIITYICGEYVEVKPIDCVAILDVANKTAIMLLEKGMVTEEEFLHLISTSTSRQDLCVAEGWLEELVVQERSS